MKARLSVAELFRTYSKEFLNVYGKLVPGYQKKALWLLAHCQTAALGGHVVRCKKCGHRESRYNSCRHRGCPQCEGSKEARWLLSRESELLPLHYFHVVFTISHVLNSLILNNQRVCFSIFFQSVAQTLQTVGKNRLKARLGFFSILHTWGQKLDFHPHIHCVVPGGGVSFDGSTWVPTSKKKRYFAPTKVLALVFRGIFIKALKRAYKQGKLSFDGDFEALINQAVKKPWVVHAQPPFGSATQVLKYLSRYTRKVAISNSRLVSLEAGKVAFSFKDYTDYSVTKICHLKATEFIRRFLMHIPPTGFVRIRHYGFMAGKDRKTKLSRIQELILGLLPLLTHPSTDASFRPGTCPICGTQSLSVIVELSRTPKRTDSS